jgi:rhodanese-related sulfurtransferase
MRNGLPFSAMLAGLAAAPLLLSSCATQPTPAATAAPAPKVEPKIEKPKLKSSERGEVDSISMEDTFKHQQAGSALIFDARPTYFYKQGHVTGAISLPWDAVDESIKGHEGQLNQAKASKTPIIVYCTNSLCKEARTVARHLSSFGYSSLVFHGGWDAWREAGLPTESSP